MRSTTRASHGADKVLATERADSPSPSRNAPRPGLGNQAVLRLLTSGESLGAHAPEMRRTFGRDVGNIRLHENAAVPREFGARAVAIGDHVAFDPAVYPRRSMARSIMLVHELTHVLQQRGTGTPDTAGAEREANHAVATAQRGAQVATPTSRPAGPAGDWELPSWDVIRERAFAAIIQALRGTQRETVAALRVWAAGFTGGERLQAEGIVTIVDGLTDLIVRILLAVVGLLTGFGTGIVQAVIGLAHMAIGLMRGIWAILLAPADKGRRLNEWLNDIRDALSHVVAGIQALYHQWIREFELASEDRQTIMIGELAGQVVALIATFEFTAARGGQAAAAVGRGAAELSERFGTGMMVLAEGTLEGGGAVAVPAGVRIGAGTFGVMAAMSHSPSGGGGSSPPPPAPVLTGMARFRPVVREWIEAIRATDPARADALVASLSHAGADIVEAIDRFWEVPGFRTVVANYASGGNMQQGMRFVMRWARSNISNPAGRSILFEMESAGGLREVDLFLDGVRYEFKSVSDIRTSLVRGSAGSRGVFGQLIRDFTFNGLENTLWVFDSARVGMTAEEIATRLIEIVHESQFLGSYPQMSRLEAAIRAAVRVWP